MNCNTTHYRANSSSVPGDPTFLQDGKAASEREADPKTPSLSRTQQFGLVSNLVSIRAGDYPIPWWLHKFKNDNNLPYYWNGSLQAQNKGCSTGESRATLLHTTFWGNTWSNILDKCAFLKDIEELVEATPLPVAEAKAGEEESLVAAGKKVYEDKGCQSCHGSYDDTNPDQDTYKATVRDIGTDKVLSKAILAFDLEVAKFAELGGTNVLASPLPKEGQYAPPRLRGTWAKGGLLHNGSVPDLETFLTPGAARPEKFRITNRWSDKGAGVSYDVVQGGDGDASKFDVYDTTRPGWGNAGHEKEVSGLTDEQERKALIEYLRSL